MLIEKIRGAVGYGALPDPLEGTGRYYVARHPSASAVGSAVIAGSAVAVLDCHHSDEPPSQGHERGRLCATRRSHRVPPLSAC
jgi:hypothetical protein